MADGDGSVSLNQDISAGCLEVAQHGHADCANSESRPGLDGDRAGTGRLDRVRSIEKYDCPGRRPEDKGTAGCDGGRVVADVFNRDGLGIERQRTAARSFERRCREQERAGEGYERAGRSAVRSNHHIHVHFQWVARGANAAGGGNVELLGSDVDRYGRGRIVAVGDRAGRAQLDRIALGGDRAQDDVARGVDINIGRLPKGGRGERQSRTGIAQENAARRRRGRDGSCGGFDLVAEADLRTIQRDAGGGDVVADVRIDQFERCRQGDGLAGRAHRAVERQAARGRDGNGPARCPHRSQRESFVVGKQ